MIQENKDWNTVKAVILNPQQRSPRDLNSAPSTGRSSNWIISPEMR